MMTNYNKKINKKTYSRISDIGIKDVGRELACDQDTGDEQSVNIEAVYDQLGSHRRLGRRGVYLVRNRLFLLHRVVLGPCTLFVRCTMIIFQFWFSVHLRQHGSLSQQGFGYCVGEHLCGLASSADAIKVQKDDEEHFVLERSILQDPGEIGFDRDVGDGA